MNRAVSRPPILEFDPSRKVIIDPGKHFLRNGIPKTVVMCFFRDVVVRLKREHRLKEIAFLGSEMGNFPVYRLRTAGRDLTVFQAPVGAPLAAGLMEELIAMGGRKFIACGGAGVLDTDIAVGHVLVPVSAVRDEGMSYHYLPPSREVKPSPRAVKAVIRTLKKEKIGFLKCKTWTTDAFYRETFGRIARRKKEGCLSVEMEAASFFAVAKFRKVHLAQILYAGDDISGKEWDHRRWHRHSSRETIFWLAVKSALSI
jgi:uridine phosphorylase